MKKLMSLILIGLSFASCEMIEARSGDAQAGGDGGDKDIVMIPEILTTPEDLHRTLQESGALGFYTQPVVVTVGPKPEPMEYKAPPIIIEVAEAVTPSEVVTPSEAVTPAKRDRLRSVLDTLEFRSQFAFSDVALNSVFLQNGKIHMGVLINAILAFPSVTYVDANTLKRGIANTAGLNIEPGSDPYLTLEKVVRLLGYTIGGAAYPHIQTYPINIAVVMPYVKNATSLLFITDEDERYELSLRIQEALIYSHGRLNEYAYRARELVATSDPDTLGTNIFLND